MRKSALVATLGALLAGAGMVSQVQAGKQGTDHWGG